MRSAGVVAKPLPWLDAYYTYSENATPSSAESIGSYGAKPFQSGIQNEVGLRLDALDHRLYATVDYFDIRQNNYSIANPGNYVSPAPVPALQPLYSDRKAKGWEFELHWVINAQLSLVGSTSKFTNRDPHNVPFRGTAEESAGLLLNYRFAKHSLFKALALTLGTDYLGKRPGDAASGVTAASTSTNIIPNQPTFYLPARTLVNVGAKYSLSKNWRVQLNIDNLFNQEYLAASINRFVVVPGAPINARVTLTYAF
jgi:iron complex outermembrane receptor protein